MYVLPMLYSGSALGRGETQTKTVDINVLTLQMRKQRHSSLQSTTGCKHRKRWGGLHRAESVPQGCAAKNHWLCPLGSPAKDLREMEAPSWWGQKWILILIMWGPFVRHGWREGPGGMGPGNNLFPYIVAKQIFNGPNYQVNLPYCTGTAIGCEDS